MPISQKAYAHHANLSRGRVSQLVRLGMPLDSFESGDLWRGLAARQRPEASATPLGGLPRPLEPAPDLEEAAESIRGAWARLERCERVAFQMLETALEAGRPDAGRLIAIHAAAVRNLADGRQRLLDLAEKERQLVSAAWVRSVMLHHDGAVAQLLRAMPRQLASRISPHDPENCEVELSQWVQQVALAALSSTDPWKCASTLQPS
jgi:hypothetical protein